ncbi:MAG TPA: hypothetical protein VK672_05835 [Solirubrobacteraceae bacterium]|jgi:hypothetical protein|nr:hypothetical protein [Solirubrobacteraceae bacterium]
MRDARAGYTCETVRHHARRESSFMPAGTILEVPEHEFDDEDWDDADELEADELDVELDEEEIEPEDDDDF